MEMKPNRISAVVTQYPDATRIIVTRFYTGSPAVTTTYKTRTFAAALKFKRDLHAGRI